MTRFIAAAATAAALLVPAGAALAAPPRDPAAPAVTADRTAPADQRSPDSVDRAPPAATTPSDGGRYIGSTFVPYSVVPKGQVSGLAARPVATTAATGASVPAADSGFDWGDAAIGGGTIAALALLASGATVAVVRHRPVAR